jgi:hypothetical protein
MRCGQVIRDHREVEVGGVTLCRPCAHGAYFENPREIAWEDMNWAPEPPEEEGDAPRQGASHQELPQLGVLHRERPQGLEAHGLKRAGLGL